MWRLRKPAASFAKRVVQYWGIFAAGNWFRQRRPQHSNGARVPGHRFLDCEGYCNPRARLSAVPGGGIQFVQPPELCTAGELDHVDALRPNHIDPHHPRRSGQLTTKSAWNEADFLTSNSQATFKWRVCR